ncbi:GTP pyrophosphokinase family protein [Kitasatospora sp. NPDC094011]|uniref:GTP pyrophosphokinase n=1 Tax=Kitasatospora sp. NPDC094011 TaxID=3364090 RepID=UPI0037F370C7
MSFDDDTEPEPFDDGASNPGTTDAGVDEFDFDEHKAKARAEYEKKFQLYEEFSRGVESILKTCLENAEISIHSIESRAKSLDSFERKAGKASRENPSAPKYARPLFEVTDLSAVRVITFFLATIDRVEEVIRREFDVRESEDKSRSFEKEEKIGYQSFHFLVELKKSRLILPEYAKYSGLMAEIQVRTILQHAWAEIEHDIQYKAVYAIPVEIKRRFAALAGLLEIADREFQAIEKRDRRLREAAIRSVAEEKFFDVEITPDSLKAYLDKKYGRDGRVSEYTYTWAVGVLKDLGFQNLGQVDEFTDGYNDDLVSKAIWGARQGQVSRFEDVLMVAAGEEFGRRHPYAKGQGENWFTEGVERRLERARRSGFPVGERTLPNLSSDT